MGKKASGKSAERVGISNAKYRKNKQKNHFMWANKRCSSRGSNLLWEHINKCIYGWTE